MTSLPDTNMKHRYFYRDPLAAAWMAKHFGMKFGIMHGRKFILSPVYWAQDNTEHPYEDVDDILESSVPLYVHPDSLHLLEPQVGDLLTSGETIRNSIAVATLADLERCGVGVIQRDGKPFHWPESEAA